MKIVALQGSPRKKGNTAAILGWVEEELKSMGHEFESIYLNSKQLNGCLACANCKDAPDDLGCVQMDEVPGILKKMVDAQVVIFASPLYFWGFTAQIKTVIDRTYCLYTRFHEPGHESLLEGQRQALLLTGAGSYDDNAEGVFAAFKRMQKPHKAINAGELFIGGCTTADRLRAAVKEKAKAFAQRIVA